jgi:hypothetical protein
MKQYSLAQVVVCSVMVALVTGFLTDRFYTRQLDRLAANPLCAAACNVLKAVRK